MATTPDSDSERRLPPGTARTLGLAALVIVLLFGGLYAWRTIRMAKAPDAQRPPVPVVAMMVTPTQVANGLDAVGSLRAVRAVMLAPEVAGRVVAIRFKAGQRVAAGAPLVQLYDAPERADRAAAEARAAFAKLQLSRSRELAPTGAEPRELLEQRRSELEQAAAAVRQLDARIAQKQIRAPFSGEIGIRRINLGQYLNPGDAIASLTALESLFVDFSVPQQELAHLRVGAPVRLASDAWPGRAFTARVDAIEPMIGEDTRNVTVQALVANPDRALRPGMYVRATLVLPPVPDALVVPATAIQTSASGDSVTVVRGRDARRGGTAALVAVTAGRRVGNTVVIDKGLKAGDVVVTEGQIRVQPGAAVRVARLLSTAGR